jgi:hypothetical protein
MKRYITPALIAVLLIILSCTSQQCSFYKKSSQINLATLTDTLRYFENALGTKTATITTLQLEKRQLQAVITKDKKLLSLSKSFSNIESIVKYNTVTRIDTIHVHYPDTLPCNFVRSGKKVGSWYSFNYKSDQKGFKIDSLMTNTETTVITGFKSKWLLGEQTLTTDVTNSNPHIRVTSLKAAEVVIPEPWYKKWYLWLAVGAIGGIFTAK